jgi:hypothetical protein
MPQTIKLALLDDYQKVAMRLGDWDRLKKRGIEITVFHEPFSSSVEDAAKKRAVPVWALLRAHRFPARADREAAQPQIHGADRRVPAASTTRRRPSAASISNTPGAAHRLMAELTAGS